MPMSKSEREDAMAIIAAILMLIVGVMFAPTEKPPLIDTAVQGPYLVKHGSEYLGYTLTIKKPTLARFPKKGWTPDLAFAWKFSDLGDAAVEASENGGTVVVLADEVKARKKWLASR